MNRIRVKMNCSMQELVSCIFIIWICNPISHEYYHPIYIFAIAVIWGIFAYGESKSSMGKALGSKIFWASLIYPIIIFLYTAAGHAQFEKSSLGVPFLVLFYMYFWNKGNLRQEKMIFCTAMLYILMISIYTLIQLRSNHYIARMLANGDQMAKAEIVSPFTAGYHEIYSYIFLAMIMIGTFSVIKRRACRSVYIPVLALLLLLLIKAQYTIAVLLLIFGVFLMAFKNRTVLFFGGFAIAFIILLTGLIGIDGWSEIVYYVSNFIPGDVLRIRFIQIGDLLSGGNSGGVNGAITRFDLYKMSWDSLMKYPLFGVGDKMEVFTDNLIGGHSTFIDRLGQYGILGGGVYIVTRIYILLKVCKTLPEEGRYIYGVSVVIYAILSILNTTNRNSLLMMMIVIIPFFIERFCGKRRIGAGRGDNDSFKDGI